ncbi:MAG: Smr/MutS family protein [Thiobacillaceae bacterium]|jgi:DNA-nicking Smr family endonuclease
MRRHGEGQPPSPPQSEEAAQLFLDAVEGVAPLPAPNRANTLPPPLKPIPKQRLNDEIQVLRDSLSDPIDFLETGETGEELFFARPGIHKAALRKLKRGGWVIQAELDLHGMRSDEARLSLAGFLQHCARHDHRCVRIIHGKGLRSRNREPILKHKLRHWLIQRDDVLAFCQARPVDGGSGAVIVLLKSATRNKHD